MHSKNLAFQTFMSCHVSN